MISVVGELLWSSGAAVAAVVMLLVGHQTVVVGGSPSQSVITVAVVFELWTATDAPCTTACLPTICDSLLD